MLIFWPHERVCVCVFAADTILDKILANAHKPENDMSLVIPLISVILEQAAEEK